jgi:t-SNARE complex subunit (syntaxin)
MKKATKQKIKKYIVWIIAIFVIALMVVTPFFVLFEPK